MALFPLLFPLLLSFKFDSSIFGLFVSLEAIKRVLVRSNSYLR